MDSGLSRLIAISKNSELRKHVKTLQIQDDCMINDPYNTSHPLRSSEIWPRDTSGHVLTQQIGVETLRGILAERHLCPENIIVRDYRIARMNFNLCPETTKTVDYRINLKHSHDPEPVAALAKEIVHDLDLPITSIEMRVVDNPPVSKNSIFFLWEGQTGQSPTIHSPEIWDVFINLLPSYEDSIAGPFSLLRSAKLNVADYWFENILRHAVNLEVLQLTKSSAWDIVSQPSDTCPFRLRKLDISKTEINADTILSILANSKDSLTELCVGFIHLKEGNTWANLLLVIADRFPNLTGLNIRHLWDGQVKTGGAKALYFDANEINDEWRSSLVLRERGPPNVRRVIGVSYEGPHVAEVLRNLAIHSKSRTRLFEVE